MLTNEVTEHKHEPVLRIAKWSETFEKSESRKLKILTWISVPVGFDSTGYQALIEEFGDEAPALYGAWCVLCAIAAQQSVRGTLASSRGAPLKMSAIARRTGFPAEIFVRLVAWASRTDIGWLEYVSADEMSRELEKNAENSSVFEGLGESPRNPPECPHDSGGIPRLPYRTEPNKTEQDITLRPTGSGYGERWAAASEGFVDRVREVARRMVTWRGFGTVIDRELIWQAAWVGVEFDRDTVCDAMDRIKAGSVGKPKSYLGCAMIKLCQRHGEDWDTLKKLVPPAPPPPPAQVKIADESEVA